MGAIRMLLSVLVWLGREHLLACELSKWAGWSTCPIRDWAVTQLNLVGLSYYHFLCASTLLQFSGNIIMFALSTNCAIGLSRFG